MSSTKGKRATHIFVRLGLQSEDLCAIYVQTRKCVWGRKKHGRVFTDVT